MLLSILLFKISLSIEIILVTLLFLFIIFLLFYIIPQGDKFSKKNRELIKKFNDNLKKMSDNSYRDFTDGHLYK